MLVRIIMESSFTPGNNLKPKVKRREIELTGNFQTVCNGRDCRLHVEAVLPTKIKFCKSHSYLLFGIFKRHTLIKGWEDTTVTKFIPIDIVHVKTTHDHYIPSVEKP